MMLRTLFPEKSDQLTAMLDQLGMEILGQFAPTDNEVIGKPGDADQKTGLMIASCGPAMWSRFVESHEFCDGNPDPMNRWSARCLQLVADEFDATLVLPFEKPFAPFQRWAMRAGGLSQSPLGILVHPVYGLWFALRGVLFFSSGQQSGRHSDKLKNVPAVDYPCENCVSKPCLVSCPVLAFSKKVLDVNGCFSHLDSGHEPDCMNRGCMARLACPVGVENVYHRDQLRFHMSAYRG